MINKDLFTKELEKLLIKHNVTTGIALFSDGGYTVI